MKRQLYFVCLLMIVLLVCGCGNSEESAQQDQINPSATTSPTVVQDPFANVEDIYKDVLIQSTFPGYALTDLDNDGKSELLLTDGEQIFELYSICDDGLLYNRLAHESNVVKVRLCNDNRIFIHQTDKNGCDYYCIHTVRTQVGNLPQELFVLTDGERWWVGPYEKDAELTTEAEAKAILDAIVFQKIEYIPLP